MFPEAEPRETLRFEERFEICYIANEDITCNGGRRSTFAGNSALSPSDVIDFAMLPAQRFLSGNSFIVRCYVT